MDPAFRGAITISLLIHSAIVMPSYKMALRELLPSQKKPIVVDYITIREKPAPSIETPKIELKETVTIHPQGPKAPVKTAEKIEKKKEPAERPATKRAEERSTNDYVNYYQLIREKIRRQLKEKYRGYSREGEVTMVFTLSSDGTLLKHDIDSSASTKDRVLIDMARASIADSSPFPAFPKGLDSPQMSFNLTISFKKR